MPFMDEPQQPLLQIELDMPPLPYGDTQPLNGRLHIQVSEPLRVDQVDLWLEQDFPGRATTCIGVAHVVLAAEWLPDLPQEVPFELRMNAASEGVFDLSGMSGAFRARSAAIGKALESAAADHYLRVQVRGSVAGEAFMQEKHFEVKGS